MSIKPILSFAIFVSAGAGLAEDPPITKEALDQAPEAEVERLGVVQTLGRICGNCLVPGTREYPPRYIVSFWSMADRSFFKTFIIELATGEARTVTEDGFDKDAPRWPWVQADDGKCFLSTMRGALAVYDPTTDKIKMVRPCPEASWLRGLAIGGDGAVYVSGYPKGDAGRYDPRTGEVEYFGPQGGPFSITNIYGYSVGSDGKWVYTASGKIPWYVVAYNRKTKQQKNLLKFNQSDFPNVRQIGKEVYLTASIVDQQAGISRVEHYLLSDGEAKPIDTPPNQPKVSYAWTDVLQPAIDNPGRGLPMIDGSAIFRYKPAEADDNEPYREVKLPIPGEPYNVRRIAPMGDGRVVVATGIYGDVFLFDPKTGSYERVGNPANRNVYCLHAKDGTIYFGGYANAFLGVFEDRQGRLLHNWNRMLGSKRTLSLVEGADGKFYLGCHAEREFVGGALAWWDPNAPEGEQAGGIRFPNDEANWTVTAMDGKYIVIATSAVVDPTNPGYEPPGGKIIVYSTEEQKIINEFVPFPNDVPQGNRRGSAGLIVEAAPGSILGFTTFQGKPLMYVCELLTSKMLRRSELPAPARGDLKRGPDGAVYTFLEETLVRINPKTYAIAPICKASPGRMAFVGADLYLSGQPELRRIRGIAE